MNSNLYEKFLLTRKRAEGMPDELLQKLEFALQSISDWLQIKCEQRREEMGRMETKLDEKAWGRLRHVEM